MTVIRRTNPLGKRLSLGRLLGRKSETEPHPARAANDRSRDVSDTQSKSHQSSRKLGA